MNSDKENTSTSLDIIVAKFDGLIAAVLNAKITPRVSPDIALWDTSDIADYIGNSYKYTSEYIVTHHTFPNAIRLKNRKGNPGRPRWYSKEVIERVATHKV